MPSWALRPPLFPSVQPVATSLTQALDSLQRSHKAALTGESKAVGHQCDFQPLDLPCSTDGIFKGWRSCSSLILRDPLTPLETCRGSGAVSQGPGMETNWVLLSLSQHHTPISWMGTLRPEEASVHSPEPSTPPRVLLSSGFLLRVLLAHMHRAIFQLGEGGVLGWTVCPGHGASLKPLGTAQPYFLRADCALTRTSCPLSIWSE